MAESARQKLPFRFYDNRQKYLMFVNTCSEKWVVANGDEGDPGAFMDRSVLESDPHRLIEGMAIAAFAVGADHGYVYVRAEYPLAIERLRLALQQARRQGVLGRGIFGSAFGLSLEVQIGRAHV